ncbi:DNA translocase FtsK [Granulibacter bethesdensis]|uniref:DNA translocase FtsK n=1 Tax=Granulibacter bethesdensis (strain ATCC BAA-1260 / CGDNIH1) TaxID=391165 RepID=Q0BQ76_GRABC|nr:Cell division protein ftsK [Granulibacter bethesdensis CGDNIH1]APH52898.1 Cell division protein ftsK [Granulibacter bethesdensis]APH60470.1 Cell division protein ftsK [Granulibacter bethesdensis]APH65586.1 Cell division protein ftsK [Granulibacter bethesdensis]
MKHLLNSGDQMAVVTSPRQRQAKRFLSPALKALAHRRMAEMGGLVLGLVALALLIALVTYNPHDPSFDTATGQEPTNLAGRAGAMLADVLLQGFGVAAILPVLAMLIWAWRISSHRGLGSVILRFGSLLVAMPVVSAVVAAVGQLVPALHRNWPSSAGPGGLSGDLLAGASLQAGHAVLGPLGDGLIWVAGLGLAILLVFLAFGLSAGEWRAAGRGAASLSSVYGDHIGPAMSRSRGLFGRGGGLLGRLKQRAVRLVDDEDDAEGHLRYDMTVMEQGVREENRSSRTARARQKAQERTPSGSGPVDGAMRDDGDDPYFPDEDFDERQIQAAPPSEAVGVPAPPRIRPDPRITVAVPARASSLSAQSAASYGRSARQVVEEEPGWQLPPLDLLTQPPPRGGSRPSDEVLQENARLLETVLGEYGVQGAIRDIRPGPVVTLYELEPAPGIRSARVIGLAEDVARSLSVLAVRIATVPGRNVIGIEVPNDKRETVYLAELLGADEAMRHPGRLALALGKDIGGAPVVADLARMPHLLIAGTTGSGKSVGVNAMILSLLYRLSPDQCRLILIDPKMLELSVYDGIPHLMSPVVTEPAKAVTALKWVVREMERRYRSMSQLSVRNVTGYNERVAEARARGEVVTRRVQTGFDPETGRPTFEEQQLALEPLPFIVVVIDEMADLMMVAGKEIEAAVQRLAQMARAAGIHVIMATQRPSVDVITGTIKANFPTRISFQVISKFDSRTILGEQGAEQLLGQGDMLYMAGGGRILRTHGPFVSDGEVEKVVDFLRAQGEPHYVEEVTEGSDEDGGSMIPGMGGAGDGEKGLFDQAVALVAREGKASTSFIQRHLSIGYNRAAKLIEQMEKEGIVGPANHVGKREVLVRRTPREDD